MKKQLVVEARSTPISRNSPETLRYFYHPDHLGSASCITDSSGTVIQSLQYLPFGEPFIDQRSTTWSSRYTFSGKERDGETGYSYFGARYYNSDISIWLSVDPLSDKYPNLTPYAYCANNPVKYWDPDGRWIPGLDDDGNTTYTAEKGDNLYTFQKQFGVGKKEALGIFNKSKISTADNASFKAGEHIIGGDVVKEHTGSDVLKGQWANLTSTQKASQLMFGMMYSEYHNQTAENGAYAMNINDFVDGFYVGSSGLNLDNVLIPLKGGGTIPVDRMSIAPSSTIGTPSLILHGAIGGDEYKRKDGSSFNSYRFECGRNLNAQVRFKAIVIAVPAAFSEEFEKSY